MRKQGYFRSPVLQFTMRPLICLVAALTGCATPGYDQYLVAAQSQAMANAEIRKANAAAIAAIAQHGDSTAKSIAVMMLALNNGPSTTPIEPPRDNALQWAAVLLPSITAVASGYYGYRLGVTQSNNQAYTTQASYGAIVGVSGKAFDTIGQFKPVPFDWAGLGQVVRPNITIGGDGVVAGRDGEINKPVTTNTDNSHDNTNVPPAPSVP